MSRPMTKQEWLSYIEQTWNAAQKEAWSEQPRREWVGLTEDEIRKCFFRDDVPPSSPPYWWEYRDPDYNAIYALIDKALREKNNG